MRITVGKDHIWISSDSINPSNRINTDAEIVLYNGRPYLATPNGKGNVIDLRNVDGKKLRSIGSKEIDGSYGTPNYWQMFEREGELVPQKIKDFYYKLQKRWKDEVI